MRMTQSNDILVAYDDFVQREKNWFQTLPTAARNILTDRGRVPDSELALFGEVGFLLLGLKPCVLIEHLPRDQNILGSYIDQVCQPWQDRWFPLTSLETSFPTDSILIENNNKLIIRGQLITHDLQSPEISLKGCYLLSNTRHDIYPTVIKNLLNPDLNSVQEEILAQILDYPGSLPASHDQFSTMIRVGYIDSKTGYWLTTYAGQSSQLPAIRTHFKTYHHQVLNRLRVDLKLDIEMLG